MPFICRPTKSQADRKIETTADERSRTGRVGRWGADKTERDDQEIIAAFKAVFPEMLGHLPVTPPAARARRRTLIDREGKWLLAGALIVSLTSGRIEVIVEG